ncbi:Nn.00g001860.m01.CDS01 [Neocucurbitaria sp. VM-36]
MEYGNNYGRPSYSRKDSSHQRVESTDDDTVGMLSKAAPSYEYKAYRPPDQQVKPLDASGIRRMSATISPLSARMTTPPVLPPSSASSLTVHATPGDFPTPRIQQSPPASPDFRPRLFGPRDSDIVPYQENVPWANSTQFRPSTAYVPKPDFEAQIAEANMSTRPSKQYFREVRHFREPWRQGVWTRLPWKGFGALGLVVLLTTGSAIILFTSNGTSPEDWNIGSDSVQPQVYVSVFEMMITLLIFYALAEGLAITFWRQLLRSIVIADVHDVYDSSFLWPAFRRALRLQFNTVGMASIFTALSFSRGPFFQRGILLIDSRYHTNATFIVLGIIVSLASIIAILPLFYGYWELGRTVSLNPLEIARAFGAPLFDGLDGNTTSCDIEMERGAMLVKYGACERYGGEKVLRVEDTARVNIRTPWEGEIFG